MGVIMAYRIIKTMIHGLDEAIGGGFTRPGLVYIVGHPGTGKTTLAVHYAYNRAIYHEEKTKYFLLTEPRSLFLDRIRLLKFERLEEFIEKYLSLETALPLASYDEVLKTTERILEDISSGDYQNLVIDSLSSLVRSLSPSDVASVLNMLFNAIAERDLTTIIIGEIPLFTEIQLPGVEEFMADVVIRLDYVDRGGEGLVIRLTPIKMRLGAIDRKYYEAAIDVDGFKVLGALTVK